MSVNPVCCLLLLVTTYSWNHTDLTFTGFIYRYKVNKLAPQAREEQPAPETRSGGGNEEESNQGNEESGVDDTERDKDYEPSTPNSTDTRDDNSGDDSECDAGDNGSWVLINF